HDSFISTTTGGRILMEFSGKELIKGEPDASSFPSGGLRATFEARGYTAWDCTSPAFLRTDGGEVTLCIPTAFCSYTGEALDKKTPLLRSMEALSKQSVRVLRALGRTDVNHVTVAVGAEQEYFLIDREKYLKRDDLIYTGRTLFGARPPKGQEMDDHYFGAIKERVVNFMKELNEELWKLGIPAKTQHNEAAPAQHELASIYTSANIATDHNQQIMESMKRIAAHHSLACLLHEKPFAGVNGSGKHNNWSLITDSGENILKPGKNPHENTQFLLFLAALIKAVDEHAGVLRMSSSNAGNDHRLGASEAPPAIISMFIGEQLEDILSQLLESGEAISSKKGGRLNIGVNTLPHIKRDANDRNRTSPFAFTGNKFEFRMVASSLSIAGPNSVLNTIVADALSDMADELEGAEDVEKAAKQIIVRTVREHQRVVFDGDGYSAEWVEEAKRRGLPNYESFVDSIGALLDEKTVRVFEKHGVLTRTELQARADIGYEMYAKTINIEARTMAEMASRMYIPAGIEYSERLARSAGAIKNVAENADVSVQTVLMHRCQKLLSRTMTALEALESDLEKVPPQSLIKDRAIFFRKVIVPDMEKLRAPVDELETIVERDLWPVPTYGDLIFEV
ncbi:MAG: glutamine synthetase III, partial [Lachnospiraceae bacterium]|nr:glutamine synthetase III [Lachnospiraceae bacterium]